MTPTNLLVCEQQKRRQQEGKRYIAEAARSSQRPKQLLKLVLFCIFILLAVASGGSALVCAPTSSGKTFISSYVIEKVLAQNDNGWVVLVLPTKALVNQLAAQVSQENKY